MTSLLNRRRPFHQLLCALLAALMAAGQTLSWAQELPTSDDAVPQDARPAKRIANDKTLLAHPIGAADPQPFDLSYAVPNTCAFIAVRPAQVLNSPLAELYPTEILQAASLQHTGLDPLAAEYVVASISPTIGGPPSYSWYARFSKPFELNPEILSQHNKPAEVAGKRYSQSNDPFVPSFCAVDSQSLLMAPDYFLRKLLSEEKPAEISPFAAAFTAADRGDDLLAMIDVAPLRGLINIGTSQAPIPLEFTPATELPNLIRYIELRANLSRPAPSSLLITANNEADAERIVAIFEEMKGLLVDRWAAEAQKQMASEDPVEQAAGRYSLRMSRFVEDRVQFQREGDQLVLVRGDLTGQGSNPMATAATIGVLVGLLLPAVQAAREAARRTSSANNLKQIMIAMHNYAATENSFPAYASFDAEGKPLLSWRVHLLPYLEQQELYKKFHLDEPWDSEHNKQLISQMPGIFLDPSSSLAVTEGKTHYLGVKGDGYLFDGTEQGRVLTTITDGLSNTIAIVQAGDAGAVTWTKPEDWEPDVKNLMKPFDPLHPGGFFAAFADASVQFISESIEPEDFKAVLTAAGGETVDSF